MSNSYLKPSSSSRLYRPQPQSSSQRTSMSSDSSSSSSSSTSSSASSSLHRFSTDSSSPRVETLRCSRCAMCVETVASSRAGNGDMGRVSPDDASASGMVRFGHNLTDIITTDSMGQTTETNGKGTKEHDDDERRDYEGIQRIIHNIQIETPPHHSSQDYPHFAPAMAENSRHDTQKYLTSSPPVQPPSPQHCHFSNTEHNTRIACSSHRDRDRGRGSLNMHATPPPPPLTGRHTTTSPLYWWPPTSPPFWCFNDVMPVQWLNVDSTS
ncbi:hypothetical protein LOCC1_G008906, partial [Lachnellula occidentalis]